MGAETGVGQKSEPNVVPLCDILLVLLIIFMVITPVAQKGIDINLPESSGDTGEQPQASKSIVLTLEADQSLKINNMPVTLERLESELRSIYQTRTEKTLFIRADETVLYENVLQVIDIAKGAGIDVLGVIPERYQSAKQEIE